MDSEKQQLLPDEVYQALSFFRYLRFKGSPELRLAPAAKGRLAMDLSAPGRGSPQSSISPGSRLNVQIQVFPCCDAAQCKALDAWQKWQVRGPSSSSQHQS